MVDESSFVAIVSAVDVELFFCQGEDVILVQVEIQYLSVQVFLSPIDIYTYVFANLVHAFQQSIGIHPYSITEIRSFQFIV